MLGDWKIRKSELKMDCKVFSVYRELVISPRTKKEVEIYRLITNNWVNVIPITPEGEIVMVKQYRHGTRSFTLEIPGGLIDDTDISPEEAGKRELLEETGYTSDDITLIGGMSPQPAIFNNILYTCIARNVKKVADQNLDEGEDIEIKILKPEEVKKLIADGVINHALVIASLSFASIRGYLDF